MYSESRVAERLEIAQRDYSIAIEEHTVSEVELYESTLIRDGKYKYDDLGKPSGVQNLTEFDRRWILNEQLLCACDAAYWLSRYCYLIDEEGVIMRFKFRMAQKILFDIISDLEDRGAAIEILSLKARQLGVTSLIQPLIGHRIFFGSGVNAIAGSADQQKTGIMASKMLLAYDMMPIWLRPTATRRVESDRGMLVFGGTLSGVSFQHGAQMSGIARGTTPTIYHLSEVASFTNAEEQIESSLLKCVHASPKVFGVLESTGEGDKGWWPDTWRYSKAHWPSSRLCPLFLPWFTGTDLYPNTTFMHMHPIPSTWKPHRDTQLHVAKCELYVRSNPLLRKHLGRDWRMPLNQQWWWELGHEEAKAKDIEGKFLQELAGDDEEALLRSSESVFGHDAIQVIENNRKPDFTAYTLTGQSIEDSHEVSPDYYDYHQERIPVRYLNRRGESYRWEFIPLRPTDLRAAAPEDVDSALLIWHHPRPHINYSIGVDTSEGKGEDSTVISVWTYGLKGQPDIQCAEFASAYVNHVEAFAFVLAIAAYYGKHMSAGETKWREPYVSIEQVLAVGDTAQLQMARMGYSNFHKMPRYDGSPRRIRHQKLGPSAKPGWYTHSFTRPLLTGNFVHSAQNGWAEINSPWLIEEMKQFEVHVTASGKEKLEHEDGAHDDRIFAAAMAIFCPHDLDTLADRSKKRTIEPQLLPPIDMGPYTGSKVSARELTEKNTVDLENLMYSTPDLARFEY